ncbi:MAG: iron ABC transporter permease [Clostridia bacterium]|nr:iron ABC transporter permease [Clostridia bacterium]
MTREKHNRFLLLLTLGLLLLTALLALCLGSTALSPTELLYGLLGKEGYKTAAVILRAIRLPRMLGGILAGAGLALSGSLLQHATDNALAAPGVLGINAGAGFCVILLLSVAPAAFFLTPFAAFFGALLSALVILCAASRVGLGKTAVVLCGVALSALFSAGISFFSVLDSDVLASYTDFSIGGLRGISLSDLVLAAPVILFCIVGALLLARDLHLLSLGDTLAASLGVPVKRVRLFALLLACASAAAAVSFAGLLGFIGLVVPHIARKLCRADTKSELLLSPLLGGILLTLADLVGRVLLSPTEIPVGIFTALLGVPFFLYLLFRGKRHA